MQWWQPHLSSEDDAEEGEHCVHKSGCQGLGLWAVSQRAHTIEEGAQEGALTREHTGEGLQDNPPQPRVRKLAGVTEADGAQYLREAGRSRLLVIPDDRKHPLAP